MSFTVPAISGLEDGHTGREGSGLIPSTVQAFGPVQFEGKHVLGKTNFTCVMPLLRSFPLNYCLFFSSIVLVYYQKFKFKITRNRWTRIALKSNV